MVTLLVVEIVALFAVLAVPLFIAAGTIDWPQAWWFLSLFMAFTIAVSAWLMKFNPGLLKERMGGGIQRGQKSWDKLFSLVAFVLFIGWLVLMGCDAVRFRWSHVPLAVEIAGAIVMLASFYVFFIVYRENSYLSSVVRIQNDRGQTVVSTGPYAHVRHPMYSAALVMIAGASLLLGSWYGLLFVVVLAIAVTYRAIREERTLRDELPGYDEYMTKVRYRFIPRVF